jgi:hypothetical protein
MNIETMKQALGALERSVSTCFDRRAHEEVMSRPEHFINQTITALRTAIAEAEKQEPVAYTTGHCKQKAQLGGCQLHNLHCGYPDCDRKAVATPTAAQHQSLTDEQIRDLWSWSATTEAERTANTQQHAFARAIEAAHGITGEKPDAA